MLREEGRARRRADRGLPRRDEPARRRPAGPLGRRAARPAPEPSGSNAQFRIAKNTLARIAAKDAGQDALIDFLQGPTGVAIVDGDAAPVAKALSDYARTARTTLELRGGVLDGRPIDAAGVQRLATLPPREQLYAQLVGGIAAPLQGFVNTLTAIPRGLVVALDQIRQQKDATA